MAAEGIPVEVACRVLDVSTSGYYAFRSRPPSARAIRHAWLTDLIVQVHQASRGTYGALRVHAELRLGHGIVVGHNAVALLMRRAGLAGATGRPKWRHATPDQIAADLVDRQFSRGGPNQLWVTDITEHPTREGKLYCAVVLDAYSRRVVGWSIDASRPPGWSPTPWAWPSRLAPHRPEQVFTRTRACSLLLGRYPAGQGLRPGALNGLGRGLLRQRHDRGVLVANAGRGADVRCCDQLVGVMGTMRPPSQRTVVTRWPICRQAASRAKSPRSVEVAHPTRSVAARPWRWAAWAR